MILLQVSCITTAGADGCMDNLSERPVAVVLFVRGFVCLLVVVVVVVVAADVGVKVVFVRPCNV